MAYSILFVLFCAILAYIPVRYALIYINGPLKDIPGPFLTKFTRLWYFHQSGTEQFHRRNVELHRKYGKFVRITPSLVSISDPSAIRQIYGANLRKGDYYEVSQEPDTNSRDLFGQRDVQEHRIYKRQINPLYSDAALNRMEDDVDVCVRQLEGHFSRISREQISVDIHHWFKCYSIDVVGLITFNKQYGNLEKGEDPHGVIKLWTDVFGYMSRVSVYPPLHKWIFRITSRLAESPFAPAFKYINTRIDDRLSEIEKDGSLIHAPDFLTGLLRLYKQDSKAFPRTKVIQAVSHNIAGGNDTLSAVLCKIILELMGHPEVLSKLREELSQGQLSDPPRYGEVRNLPYLHAVVQEGLRTHPAVAFLLAREVPAGGLEIAGHYFPEKTNVAMSAWVVNRDEDIFGADVETFRPERWLGDSADVQRMNQMFMAYGDGPRGCIGRNIASMILHKTIATLIPHYDFILAQPKEQVRDRFRVFVGFEPVMVTMKDRKA